eukprot:6039448-Amphidinium_carterae.1
MVISRMHTEGAASSHKYGSFSNNNDKNMQFEFCRWPWKGGLSICAPAHTHTRSDWRGLKSQSLADWPSDAWHD